MASDPGADRLAPPPEISLDWPDQFRVVASEYPPISFFETLVDPDLMDELFYLESLTNERLRDQVGEIALVRAEDRISGPGSSPVMAAFTHIGYPSRFSDGSFGVYYAAKTLETAIAETSYHRARFLSYTNESPGEIDMRVYVGKIAKPFHDVRGPEHAHLHDPHDDSNSRQLGAKCQARGTWGIVYRSVRNPGGECIAALRPPAVTIPVQGPHLSYVWNGSEISSVYKKTRIR